jgi:serine protease Do
MKYAFWITLLSVGLLFGATISLQDAPPNPGHQTPTEANTILSFHQPIGEAINAVVNISTKKHRTRSTQMEQYFNDPAFRFFFGPEQWHRAPQQRMERSLGSGVILSKEGYIVTNSHVVEGADEIIVTLNDQKKAFAAKLVGSDPASDLAVIRIEAEGLQPIRLSRAKDVRIGDVVFAIGNPFGVGETVTQGIVSALNKQSVGINQYENFIQTDASINPGNSGGALIDSRGALIGINTAILSKSGGNHGVGFAIPVDMVRDVVAKLVSDGKVARGYMGVVISDVTEQMQALYTHKEGAVVTDVQQGSAAEQAGIKRGDLIYAVDAEAIDSSGDLRHRIAALEPGSGVVLSIEREGREIQVSLTLGSKDRESPSTQSIIEGATFGELDAQKRARLRIPSGVIGVVIEQVEPGSKAQKEGFYEGDVIIQVENRTIETLKDLREALEVADKKPKRIYINRRGTILLLIAS